MSKPRVGIYGFTGCAGDQLAILNCEDELLELASLVNIVSFRMASSKNDDTNLDIAFIEGSINNEEQVEELKEIRRNTKLLVAIGTCATYGGVQAMKNEVERKEFIKKVYGNSDGRWKTSLPAQPLSAYVQVDYAIPGCPIEKWQFLQAVASLLHGDLPLLPNYPVCTECKIQENVCLLMQRGELCLGPVTVAGCYARCPSHNRPCHGCRGPIETPNVTSELNILLEKGFTFEDVKNQMRNFAAPSEAVANLFSKEPVNAAKNKH